MVCSVVRLLGLSLKHSLASRSRPGDPLPFANGTQRRRASRSVPQDSLVSRLRPGDPLPFVNGARHRQASRSVPQAFPCVPLAPRQPAALRKWRAASLAFPSTALSMPRAASPAVLDGPSLPPSAPAHTPMTCCPPQTARGSVSLPVYRP
ncbi:hypothetical protein K488DRAFT_92919 [Vararia minispora EC-137]|uniref:Uncharacterized protein n=1 Tax=Vararia minispora EC-137 TaxID=1314806 RepID=A0ACB8Q4C2_9AGAM|nr:hypothetical protein K488DRAFT_92919 [Vararia minispora EC-137]